MDKSSGNIKKGGMMRDKYILDGKQTVECNDWEKWSAWLEENDLKRHVADEYVGEVRVSTVFLGVDHVYDSGPPLLFETMVFGGSLDGEQERCTNWEQAEIMHKNMVERVKAEDSNVKLRGCGDGTDK